MEEQQEFKTKSYVRRAQNNYRAKFDQVNLMLPKGLRELIPEKTGKSVNAYIRELVLKDMTENYGYEMPEE